MRQLEDLVIQSIYDGVVQARMDQAKGQVEVSRTIGRDVRPEQLADMIAVLQHWSDRSSAVLGALEAASQSISSAQQLAKNGDTAVQVQRRSRALCALHALTVIAPRCGSAARLRWSPRHWRSWAGRWCA